MNIKSLLLGSAAALLAVSGARAADAVVVAEPEPMEYVRICDVYGTGFYYIPGTETCLRIGGLVRYEIDGQTDDDGWKKIALARLKMDARSESEFGTFRRYIEIQHSVGGSATEDNGWIKGRRPVLDDDDIVGSEEVDVWTGLMGESGTTLRYAYIELGGLLIGHTDTLWDGGLSAEFDQNGGDRINQIRYTFDAGNGITLSASLEEESYNFDYVPLVVGKVSFAQGWGSVDLWAAYDDAFGEGAFKALASFKATDALTVELLATYETGPSYWSVTTEYIGYEWTVGADVVYKVNEKLGLTFGGQYLSNLHDDNLQKFVPGTGTPPTTGKFVPVFGEGGDNNWRIGADIDYNIIQNLDTKLSVNYYNGDSFEEDGGVVYGFIRLDAAF
ncbi:porin [Mesorhizobium sp. ANAO-SY3R2]|uniref:porin n=1 Tax=Mesorhizobium sp. ANAO-SY3R2 TaxID=3166644 RepID=UPI00367302B2